MCHMPIRTCQCNEYIVCTSIFAYAGDVPLSHVMPLVEGSLRHAAEEQRNLSVLRQLRR